MSKKTTTAEPKPKQYVAIKCVCGKGTGQYLDHYEIVRCACGAMFWALRPVATGPLIAYPWPGLPKKEPYQPA